MNWKYKISFLEYEDDIDVGRASRETVGIQNLYREIVNKIGTVTGEDQHTVPGIDFKTQHKHSGADNSIMNQKPSGNPNAGGDGGSNDPSANNGRNEA